MLMYPKETGKRKRRKHHPPSILHPDDGTCYLCRRLNNVHRIHGNLEEHHVFGGPNRRISEENGFLIRKGKWIWQQENVQRHFTQTNGTDMDVTLQVEHVCFCFRTAGHVRISTEKDRI